MKIGYREAIKTSTTDYGSKEICFWVEFEYDNGYDKQKAAQETIAFVKCQLSQGTPQAQAGQVQQGQGNHSQVSPTPKQAVPRPYVPATQNTQGARGTTVSPAQMKRLYAIAMSNGLLEQYKAAKMQLGVVDGKAGTNCTKQQYKELEAMLGA